ncbi:MAG TPA: competence protein TfoX [Ruminococcaceae bacterium]|nr:competence protein TfoX [Oscillospiraceae bacterium]
MGELTKLPNIAKVMEEQLNKAGIFTAEQLKQTGSRQAWLNIKSFDSSACYNRLCALEGAIRGIRWHYLPYEVKKELKEFYNTYK